MPIECHKAVFYCSNQHLVTDRIRNQYPFYIAGYVRTGPTICPYSLKCSSKLLVAHWHQTPTIFVVCLEVQFPDDWILSSYYCTTAGSTTSDCTSIDFCETAFHSNLQLSRQTVQTKIWHSRKRDGNEKCFLTQHCQVVQCRLKTKNIVGCQQWLAHAFVCYNLNDGCTWM